MLAGGTTNATEPTEQQWEGQKRADGGRQHHPQASHKHLAKAKEGRQRGRHEETKGKRRLTVKQWLRPGFFLRMNRTVTAIEHSQWGRNPCARWGSSAH